MKNEVKFIPILFTSPMVQAILNERKTQTRRNLKIQPSHPNLQVDNVCRDWNHIFKAYAAESDIDIMTIGKSPYGQPGDVLWVRETIYQNGEFGLEYVADNEPIEEDIIPQDFNVRVDKNGHYKFCKIPNIYMEKWACRIFLKVKSVRVERLQDISEVDALSEGTSILGDKFIEKNFPEYFSKWKSWSESKDWETKKPPLGPTPKARFSKLWQSINGNESWDANPWVWVVEFEKIERPDNFL